MLLKTGLLAVLLVLGITLCRGFCSDRPRTRLLAALAVASGCLLLGVLPVRAMVEAAGKPLAEFTRQVAYALSPFLLVAVVAWTLHRLTGFWWRAWPAHGTAWRVLGLLGAVTLGLVLGLLALSLPLVPEALTVTRKATTAGVRAGWDAALALLGGGEGAA
jgi:hypothetical protein